MSLCSRCYGACSMIKVWFWTCQRDKMKAMDIQESVLFNTVSFVRDLRPTVVKLTKKKVYRLAAISTTLFREIYPIKED